MKSKNISRLKIKQKITAIFKNIKKKKKKKTGKILHRFLHFRNVLHTIEKKFYFVVNKNTEM